MLLMAFILPSAGIIVSSSIDHRNHEIEGAKKNALMLVQSVAAQQEQIATGTKQMLSTLAYLPEVRKLDTKACNALFCDLNNRYPYYSNLSAATPDGKMFASSIPFNSSINLSDRKHIRDAIRTLDFSAGEYIVGRASQVPSINYTYPVLDADNNLLAIVIAGFKLDNYGNFTTNINLSEGSVLTIADHKGARLYRLPMSDAIAPNQPVPVDTIEKISGNREQGIFEKIGQDGVDRIYAFKQLRLREHYPPYLYMIIGIAKTSILEKANSEMMKNLLILGFAASIAIMVAWFLGRFYLVRPINRLVTATQQLSDGQLGTRTCMAHTPDELGLLAKAFDDMASLLESRNLEREKAEEALHQSETRYRLLAENATDVIWTVGMDMQLTYVSPSVTRLLGFTVEEAMARTMQQAYTPAAFKKAKRIFVEEMAFESAGHEDPTRSRMVELELIRKDGNTVPIEGNFSFLRDSTGKVIGILSIVRDITERKQAEDLRVSRNAAEAASIAKSQFLANMSHEIRTPMNGVIGMIELLLVSELTEKQHKFAKSAYLSATALLNVINDILDFSKIEAGKLTLEQIPFSLTQILNEVKDLLIREVEDKGLSLEIPMADLPAALVGDPFRIRQILINLVGNAIKFTESGNVMLTVNVLSMQDKTVRLRFEVTDTGIGISQEQIKV
ncbi:MAG: PAS domain S-box protein, partial [Deltaproteobacteria bacterium]|nr:PAS domain S-box protein [Deltaproteobacteria bacterium]